MQCPICNIPMIEKDFGGVKVDICSNGCQGIWFDWVELGKLDEHNEGMGEALTLALNSSHKKDPNRGQIPCPKCSKEMVAHLYKSAKLVTVDECYSCGGFFLDSGELKVIRDNFMSEKQRSEYLNTILKEIPSYITAKEEQQREIDKLSEKGKQRVDAIKKMTGYLNPSTFGQ